MEGYLASPSHLQQGPACVFTALTAKRPRTTHLRITEPIQNWLLPTKLPSPGVDKLIGGKVGLKRNSDIKNPMEPEVSASR
jgi:hypothetical protein